jgi:hypothetical protein
MNLPPLRVPFAHQERTHRTSSSSGLELLPCVRHCECHFAPTLRLLTVRFGIDLPGHGLAPAVAVVAHLVVLRLVFQVTKL